MPTSITCHVIPPRLTPRERSKSSQSAQTAMKSSASPEGDRVPIRSMAALAGAKLRPSPIRLMYLVDTNMCLELNSIPDQVPQQT